MRTRAGCIALLVAVLPVITQAAPLGLFRNHYPLVVSDWISISYDPNDPNGGGNGVFVASGYSNVVNISEGNSHPANFGTFALTAVIVPSSGEELSGTLLVTELDGYSNPTTLFSSSTIKDFGFCAEDMFEFLFTQEDGTLAPLGATLGIILDGRNAIGEFSEPRFDISFSGDGSATSDSFYIPEPAGVALLTLGGLGLLRRRRS